MRVIQCIYRHRHTPVCALTHTGKRPSKLSESGDWYNRVKKANPQLLIRPLATHILRFDSVCACVYKLEGVNVYVWGCIIVCVCACMCVWDFQYWPNAFSCTVQCMQWLSIKFPRRKERLRLRTLSIFQGKKTQCLIQLLTLTQLLAGFYVFLSVSFLNVFFLSSVSCNEFHPSAKHCKK